MRMVYPWITHPRGLKNGMATTRLARLSKIRLAEIQQVTEAYVGRFASHLVEDFL